MLYAYCSHICVIYKLFFEVKDYPHGKCKELGYENVIFE